MGPDPTDRGKPCSKRHAVTDVNGTPLALRLPGTNVQFVEQSPMSDNARQDDHLESLNKSELLKYNYSVKVEEIKFNNAIKIEEYKASIIAKSDERRDLTEEKAISYRTVTDYAQIAVRTVILANGTGATAILAFIGNSLKNGQATINTGYLGLSAIVFAFGVVFGVLATVFAYFSQHKVLTHYLIENKSVIPGKTIERTAGIISLFMGLLSFLVGVLVASWGYTRMYPS